MARKSWYVNHLEAEDAKREALRIEFAAMTEAQLARLLVEAQDESAELSRTWGRDNSDAWCSHQANRLFDRIEIARAELRSRNEIAAA